MQSRDERWFELHCGQSVPMRQIARAEGVWPSTVMRGVRRHGDVLDAPPPPPPTDEELVRRMRNVLRYRRKGRLDARQVDLAIGFYRSPAAWREALPPRLWDLLHYLVVENGSVEALEARRGWPVRSSAAVLSVLLETLDGAVAPAAPPSRPDEVDELREQVAFLTGHDDAYLPFVTKLGLTPTEARLLTILVRAKGRPLEVETLCIRLWGLRPEAEWPDDGALRVHIVNLRKRLEGTHYRIETVTGVGYRLAVEAAA